MTDRQHSHLTLSTGFRFLVCAIVSVLAASHVQAQSTDLTPGTNETREIGPGQSHLFQFVLERDQMVDVTLFAKDFRLMVRVIAPDGSNVMEVAYTRYGPLTWNLVASQSGRYQFSISLLEQVNPRVQYEFKIARIRPADLRDRKAAAVVAGFHRAEILRSRSESPNVARILGAYREAATTWTAVGKWAQAAIAWEQLAEIYFNRGDYKAAFPGYLNAEQVSRRSEDPLLNLRQHANVGYVYVFLGDLDKAAGVFDQCQRTLAKIPDDRGTTRKRVEAQLQNNQGEVKYLRGDLKASLEFFDRALALSNELGDRRSEALVRLNRGYSYLESGSVNEATQEFESSLRLWREIADKRGEALSLTAQGTLYTLLGDRYAAATSHRKARELFRIVGDQQGEAITSNGLGKVFEDLNRKQEALDNYSLALRLNRQIGNKDFESVSAYYLGRVWRDIGDLDKALQYYNDSLSLCRRLGKLRMASLASMDIASVLVKQQKFTQAESIYRRTLAFYQKISDLRRQALTHQGFGELYRGRGRPVAALSEYALSLNLFERIKEPQGQADSLYWLAWLSQQQGDLKQALAYSDRAIELIEFQRARIVGQNWRSSYFASVRRHFELYVDILMQLEREQPDKGFATKAFEASEQSRARSLLETLAESQSEVRLGVDQALLVRERQLRQQLSAKGVYQMNLLSASGNDQQPEVEEEIRRLTNDYDFIQAQIKAQSPAFAQLVQPSTLTLQQIQASLKEESEGTVLLEYMLGVDRSYVWLVTANGLISRELPGRRTLENVAYEVYEGLTARRKQPNEGRAEYHERYPIAEKRFCPSAAQLSQILLAPLASAGEVQRLLIAADGSLQYLPFDALPAPNADGSLPQCRSDAEARNYQPLLEKFEVINLPSFSSLTILRQFKFSMPPSERGIAVWADPVFELDDPRISPELTNSLRAGMQEKEPLPARLSENPNEFPIDRAYLPPTRLLSTEEEAQSIMQFAPAGLTVLLTGFAANRESTISRDWNNYRILHFATHSFVNTRYPALSGLLLSTIDEQGKSQNGLLQLHDIYGLQLNADLVVLSGCQTGLGEELSGEGLVGLTQGFLYAGSRSVIVSLWPVEDKTTANLMAAFYEAMLKDHLSPARALRQAKLKMLQHEPSRAPYYWAAFVIQGEYRSPSASGLSRIPARFVWAGVAFFCIATWLAYTWLNRRRQARNQANS